MADNNGLLARKFLVDKKSIKMEDCIMYIEQFKPEDKSWFFHLSTDEVEQQDGKKAVRPWVEIKKEFYNKYFPASGELSKRMKLFAGWDIADETAKK